MKVKSLYPRLAGVLTVIFVFPGCSTDNYPRHIFKNPLDQAAVIGIVDDGVVVQVSCLDDLPDDPGKEFTCSAGSFTGAGGELLTVRPCPLEGKRLIQGNVRRTNG